MARALFRAGTASLRLGWDLCGSQILAFLLSNLPCCLRVKETSHPRRRYRGPPCWAALGWAAMAKLGGPGAGHRQPPAQRHADPPGESLSRESSGSVEKRKMLSLFDVSY